MIKKYKNLIIAVVVIVVVVLAYNYYFAKPEVTDLLTPKKAGENNSTITSQSVVTNIQKIRNTNLDKEVFKHPILAVLVDQSEQIPKARPEDIGKNNPFAPIDSRVVPTNNATSTPGVIKVNR